MNKSKLIGSIIGVVLFILLISGMTYAYIVAVTNEGQVDADTGELDINYSSPGDFTGNLSPSPNRSGGLTRTAYVSLNTDSVSALFNMYITPTVISDSLKILALKWEVEGIVDSTVVYTNSGNFSGSSVGTPIKIVNNYTLLEDVTTFNVYIWIDEGLINSAINNASFEAKINVDSTPITGAF